jgi:hypothetical protein
VTYPNEWFSSVIGCFLIESLKATACMALSGPQTPYPQKRQQSLGATCASSSFLVENPAQAAYFAGLSSFRRVKNGIWLFIDQILESIDLYGLQPTANILSTETPTEIGGKS